MNMTGIVYRPPYEANSLLLQVTLGCSHNKCTFCYMYPDVEFSVCPMEQIEADIEEAAKYCPDVDRVFLNMATHLSFQQTNSRRSRWRYTRTCRR